MKTENPLEELLAVRAAAVKARDGIDNLSPEALHELAWLMERKASGLPEQFDNPGALRAMYDNLIKSADKAIEMLKNSAPPQ